MDWEPYDYSIVYAEPYRVQQITSNWRLPFPVALVNQTTFYWSQSLNIYFTFIYWLGYFFSTRGLFLYRDTLFMC